MIEKINTIIVDNIYKKFKISKKQQKIEKTNALYKEALKGVSFTVNKGEIFGLLGPNGAGKTTTLRCLSTILSPDAGKIIINGLNISNEKDMDNKKDIDIAIKKELSFLTNELKLEECFTPNYLYEYFSKLHNIDNKTMNERKNYLFKTFGIDKFEEVKIGSLSTGMKQKISIALSLVHDPDIIVFDEPTNGLDVITSKIVLDFLKEQKEKGKTIIISTHIMSLAESICDRFAILINGKIKCCGDKEVLCKEKSLEELFFDLYKEEYSE